MCRYTLVHPLGSTVQWDDRVAAGTFNLSVGGLYTFDAVNPSVA